MNRITFDTPKPMEEVREQYDIGKVSILTTPDLYPLIKGIEFSGSANVILEKKRNFPIKRKMDAHIEAYENAMLKEWAKARKKLIALKNKVKEFKKMDYNNAATIDRIAKIPFKYKKQFVETADKYDLNLALLDKIVMNPSLLVNARYDNRKNLMELNPDYLEQHGMIRIGDSGELISETSKTFIHEYGHAFWYNSLTEEDRRYWQGLSRFLERKELTGDMTQYVVGEKKRFDGSTMYSPYYTLRDDPFVSVYARFNPREDWAESYLYYKVAPKTLERIDKKKYTFFEDKVGNRMEKEVKKVFAPTVKDPNKFRDVVMSELDRLNNALSYKAKEHITNAFNLGRQKGVYYLRGIYSSKLEQEDKEEIQRILARNDEYLDDFMDEIADEYDDVLFIKTPTGFVEKEREYDDVAEFDTNFDEVLDTQEYRLGIYAINGLSLGLMAGLVSETKEDFGGGFWHTSDDGRVCDGCDRLDGNWMSYDEFLDIYGKQDCDGNCRCGELFEPSLAPEGSEMAVIERMVKGGEGSGRYPKGSGKEKKVYWEDLSDTQKQEYKDRRTFEVKALEGLKYPLDAVFTGEKVKILGSADSFEPYKSEIKDGKKDYTQLMVQDNTGKKFITFPNDLYVDGKPLMSSVPPTRKSFTSFLERVSKGDIKPIVAVDYHGTINVDGKVNEDVKAKLIEMRAKGYHIIVYTAGINKNPSILNGLNQWLQENEVPYDEVWQRQGKPDAELYLDDKSFNPTKEDITQLEV